MKKNRELDQIWLDYRDLKEFRMKASYKIYEFSSEEVEQDVLPLLSSIRNSLKTCLHLFSTETSVGVFW